MVGEHGRGGRDSPHEPRSRVACFFSPTPAVGTYCTGTTAGELLGGHLAPILPSAPGVNENQLATEPCILVCILSWVLTPFLPPRGRLHTAALSMSFFAPQTLPQEAGNARHFPSP